MEIYQKICPKQDIFVGTVHRVLSPMRFDSLSKNKGFIRSEIEFHLDLRIHYQFAVISQRLYKMIILDDFFRHDGKT